MIDWDRVEELRDEVGADDLRDVVELFLDEVEAELSALPSSTDAPALERRLHFLKGSALNLGFSDFSNLCRAGEAIARDGNAGSIDAKAIAACYDASKSQFLAGIGQLLAR